MTLEETKQKILESDEFVIEETRKLQVLYNLKQVIRYAHDRTEYVDTESVAEHVFGAQILAEYFLPLEDPDKKWDKLKVHEMLLVHDLGEIATGDIVAWMKTDADRKLEEAKQQEILANLPNTIKEHFTALMEEYEARETPEAKFVKAVEKMDPFFHLYTENGKIIMQELETTKEKSAGVRKQHITSYPYIYRFYQVIHDRFVEEGYFISSA